MKEIFQTAVTFDLNEKKSYTTPNSTIIQLESELMLNPNSPGGTGADLSGPGSEPGNEDDVI